ncbi:uncharacterized protein LOC131078704 [Cryptomeria japonica]|uniref:uncharacterized protein LOC131078704 n=1 Tax=Cryptomeria japonica TaxID=3369 RepID=UPI0027D9D3B2|nr:uncharacterized protein LOC131078704 [Cryptomeria japonica]
MSVKNGYIIPQTPPADPDAKKEYEYNAKAKHVILSGLTDTNFVRVIHCTSVKVTWDKLRRIYEGDMKVKEAKLQNLQAQFESLKMKEEEKIVDYLKRVDEIVNVVRGLEEDVTNEFIIKKVLRSPTTKYDTKVSIIEEAKDLKTFSMDELFGLLSPYEMRIVSAETSKREATFNVIKRGKEVATSVDEDDPDTTESNFIRNLKKGSRKYKGKLPFKCFNYEKIEYLAARCPYEKKEDNNEESFKDKDKKNYKSRIKKFQKKKSLYTIDSDIYDYESESTKDYSEDEKQTNLFMT